jgi:hypothetical protein
MTELVTMSETKRGNRNKTLCPYKLTIRTLTNNETEIIDCTKGYEKRKIKPENQRLLNRNFQ